jgi:anti-sigma factor RsiW
MSADDPLDRLIADWLSDRISPDDFRTLDARLRTDPAARAALRRAASPAAGPAPGSWPHSGARGCS